MNTLEGKEFYKELHRPQFHFTAKKDWINDPNGLVYHKGEYHLFFQHSPGFLTHAPNSWGHAISKDLLHWKQMEHAIEPDEYGFIWSGSAVVDWNNTSGLQNGNEAVIIAIYTTGGFGYNPNPCVQAIAYSNDCGRTFTKYPKHILGHICAENRDPKVIWHKQSGKWIMALYLEGDIFSLFGSKDLKRWDRLCDLELGGTGECPDIFELPVDGDTTNTRWVLWSAAGTYQIGTFDGNIFTPETRTLKAEFGPNGYAAQTWSNLPVEDYRTIQISWMINGNYPCMPFNQQMSFPVEISLNNTLDGLRLFRVPIREIKSLRNLEHRWHNYTLKPGYNRREIFKKYGLLWQEVFPKINTNLIIDTSWDLFEIEAEIEFVDAAIFGAIIHGNHLCYEIENNRFTYLEKEILAECQNRKLQFQILVDRTSLELFVSGGRISASFCFLPKPHYTPIEFFASGGSVRIISLTIFELASTWV